MAKADNLQGIFLSEAAELMASLEQGLLMLENNAQDAESINSVFRAMHTLKGSASMFGYEAIAEITHDIETVYDAIRHGKRQLTPNIVQITFQTLDLIQGLLAHPKGNEALTAKKDMILNEMREISNIAPIESIALEKQESIQQLFYILFTAHTNIFQKGINTLYLAEDVIALGKGLTFPFFQNLPSFLELDPIKNFLHFEIILETEKSERDIRDVFMFVEDDCRLEVISFAETVPPSWEAAKQKLDSIASGGTIRSEAFGFSFFREKLFPANLKEINTQLENSAGKAKKSNQNGSFSSIRVDASRLDELMNLVSELVTTQARLGLFSSQGLSPELSAISENVEKITRRLRDNAFSMSLIPIESLMVRFQRLVRDLSKDLNKKVNFKTEGTDTEIDKSIIEKLADPLLHILRNSMDHGLESPDVRKKKGKREAGTVTLRAYHAGANVVIEIEDDGAGINAERVRKKAVEKNLIAADAELSKQELINLIFLPGFSTAETVTGVSGRGVGMDVVQRNITDIRGEVEVKTEENTGTTFTIRLPLTLSIIDGLLVRIGETDFILPLSSVNKCYEVETETLANAFNQWVTLEGERTPFIFLRQEFNINHGAPALSQVIKIAHEQKYVGLAFDRIIGEYQAVLKPLGTLYHDQDEFSGATILGDGSVALILDPYRLTKKLVDKQQVDLGLAISETSKSKLQIQKIPNSK